MPKYAMVIDQRRCIGCMACIVACKAENNVPPEQFRTRVLEKTEGQFPNLRTELRSELCNHCDNPPCVYNCPTRASYKSRLSGLVLLDKKRCVGCKACVAACPYDARYIDHNKGFADKCTFCDHRIKEGKEPACVATCIGKSRIFGDLNDPKSPVRLALKGHHAELPMKSAGTEPRVYYIRRFGTE
ncbi:4Fe-4S dicluster domain-containing protein [Trichlorobacter lovleyi]|uniref:4Fe-4S ferredoxin iron-sulfur binding domain protein n=1 Tax=Trichlorobacter lovleyi (strain ATCC BAA-1151 / DSM 17278 / SZ) TaxID=398767 RepID=B3E6R0_TRIL1|nr:4Fe-4S dicluster domain-containing protein [Trichlorobacter lovleyi]ACD94885.1 4Fe-4S ferredoxin iron-sulfur binding domain protein [Trichlorobacter lovleyi SZ]